MNIFIRIQWFHTIITLIINNLKEKPKAKNELNFKQKLKNK